RTRRGPGVATVRLAGAGVRGGVRLRPSLRHRHPPQLWPSLGAALVTSPHLSPLVASPAALALAAFLSLAAAMIVVLLALNWWHRLADRRQAQVRRAVASMLAAWRQRPPTPSDILWLSARRRADGRAALGVCLEALAGLEPEHAGRVREALSRSG